MSMTSPILVTLGIAILVAMPIKDNYAQSPVTTDRQISTQKKSAPTDAAPADVAMGCLIEPSISSQVAASAPGILASVNVERGDTVEKGQIIAVLDDGVETAAASAAKARAHTQAQINTARASRDMARQKHLRIKKLQSLSYGAQLELDLAQGELAVSEHRLQQAIDNSKVATREHLVAKQQLAQRLVRSPIDGIVADRMLNPGERADGRPIVRVIQLDRLRVEVILPADRFGKVQSGMSGQVTPDIANASALTARVVQVDKFIDPASGTFRARLAMANSDLAVPAGVRCDVSFDTEPKQADRG